MLGRHFARVYRKRPPGISGFKSRHPHH
jgi:hypothetical protein